LPTLKRVKAKAEELNDPANGRMLPGVEIEPYYDRTARSGAASSRKWRTPKPA
jgi:hypothetical protein